MKTYRIDIYKGIYGYEADMLLHREYVKFETKSDAEYYAMEKYNTVAIEIMECN